MLHPGLVSVTFRKLTRPEIVGLVAKAGLNGIEWGGDLHVPHGDLDQAREARRLTVEAGLRVAAYGSYYRVGHEEELAFAKVLDSAVTLGAPVIRVWAGRQGSAAADVAYRARVVGDAARIGELAATARIPVAFEFHAGTLTDTIESTQRLLTEISHPNVKTCWQPNPNGTVETRVQGLRTLLPWLTNIHAFYWETAPHKRCPLAEGAGDWSRYLQAIAATGRDHDIMLEFVTDDEPKNFLRDAATLKSWL